MKCKLIAYYLSSLDQYHKVLVNRALFGYIDNSNKGKYQYRRKGILSEIPHFKLLKGAIIVRKEDCKKIISVFKKYNVKYLTFDIEIKRSLLH